MDGDADDSSLSKSFAPAVDSVAACSQADVVFFGDQKFGVIAEVADVGNYAFGDLAVPGIFTEASIG